MDGQHFYMQCSMRQSPTDICADSAEQCAHTATVLFVLSHVKGFVALIAPVLAKSDFPISTV